MLDIRDWLGIFSVWSTLLMAIGIDPFVEDQPLEGRTFGESLKRWGPAMRALFFGLTRNGLSTDPDKVPLAGFLAFLRFYTVMRRDAWAFGYFPNGSSEIIEKLSAKIKALGGEIRYQSRVKRITKYGDWIAHFESDSSHDKIKAPYVILASDLPASESIIKNSFPADVGAGSPRPYFFPHGLAHAVICLWFDRTPRKTPEFGIFSGEFIMHNFFWLHKIYELVSQLA